MTIINQTFDNRNLIYSKKLFWFGTDAIDLKAVSGFKADKATDVAHHITAWAAETGKGLLFFSEKGDKASPHGVVQLVRATPSGKLSTKYLPNDRLRPLSP